MTLVAAYLAFRYRIPSRWVIAILASLLVIATIYLRYHYVIDLAGGLAFTILTVWSGKRIQRVWERFMASAD
jgi:membrane-associated phospholipid phosphatase